MFTKGRHISFVANVMVLMLGLSLLLITACNARDERPNRDRPQDTPTASPIIAPTSVPVTATQTRVPSTPTSVPPTATQPAPTTTTVPTPARLAFKKGRNDYVITVDNTPRQFIVYVSSKYDPSRPTPVVIIYHSSNHNGEEGYNNSTWVAKAEQENIIVVFPTSWKYLLTSSNRVEAKWYDVWMEVTEPTVKFKDDVHFTRVILDQLKATFNVDGKRLYATGYSNGAFFVITRLMLQMNDVFAAFATCAAGPYIAEEVDTSRITTRANTSLYKMFGTNDRLASEDVGLPLPFPFSAKDILNHPNFRTMLLTLTTILDLDMSYTVESKPAFTKLTFDRSLVGSDNEFIFQMIRGMDHVYPNGVNNPARLDAADLFWGFFLRHVRP